MAIFAIAMMFYAGCSSPPNESGQQLNLPFMQSDAAIYTRYAPAQIDILPISKINPAPSVADYTISVYVSLLDSFGSQIKSPATFRFELFQQVQRSSEPKGKRIVIWPDINLTDPAVNNNHWQDFLRAYLFTLPLEKPAPETILQVTCIIASGKRLTAEYPVRLGK